MTPSRIKKYSFMVRGRKTSVSLEPEFRTALDAMADDVGISTNALICRINAARDHANLSSAIRLYVLRHASAAMSAAVREAGCEAQRHAATKEHAP
jgi:predicted DNA-binding ribbon-helix-helix protein